MSRQTTPFAVVRAPLDVVRPLPDRPRGHAIRCGCLSCAEWRAALRERGYRPTPAHDWRGEPLPTGEEW